MDDVQTYQIQISGQVAEGDIESFCPPAAELRPCGDSNTLLLVRTDQAGMVGLIRHLHGQGFVLLSIDCLPTTHAEEE